MLQTAQRNPLAELSLERFDDIAVEELGDPRQLLQLKHHLRSAGNLTNAGADLWKTLRIWAEGYRAGVFRLPDTLLGLVTTGSAPEGSAASYLRAHDRDIDKAAALLEAVTTSSKSEENRSAYEAFLHLDPDERRTLLASMYVFDSAPNIGDVLPSIELELRWAADLQFVPRLSERLIGWWENIVVERLIVPVPAPISARELTAKVDDLRNQFSRSNLPIDFQNAVLPTTLNLTDDHRQFVWQLRLVALSNERILRAIRDYYRAFEQRAKWIRVDLLVSEEEIEDYENKLKEEWQLHFLRLKEDLIGSEDDDEKARLGRRLYNQMEDVLIPIRPNCVEPYVCRGSYHMLADDADAELGWHPEFVERLRTVLAGVAEAV